MIHKDIAMRHKRVFIWLGISAILFVLYYVKSEWFDIFLLENLVNEHKFIAMLIYVILLSIIGLTFIPSTPFTLAGLIIFSPWEAIALNMITILSSTIIVYYFAQFLGLSVIFEDKYPKQIAKIKKKLENKELPIIAIWSFTPFVPTDLIIYVSSGMRIPLWKCVVGVLIGEGILNFIMLYSAGTFFG